MQSTEILILIIRSQNEYFIVPMLGLGFGNNLLSSALAYDIFCVNIFNLHGFIKYFCPGTKCVNIYIYTKDPGRISIG
jgi:hypothetical protein